MTRRPEMHAGSRVRHRCREGQPLVEIVECNCFNGSPFYDADATAIVHAVSVFQSERWQTI